MLHVDSSEGGSRKLLMVLYSWPSLSSHLLPDKEEWSKSQDILFSPNTPAVGRTSAAQVSKKLVVSGVMA